MPHLLGGSRTSWLAGLIAVGCATGVGCGKDKLNGLAKKSQAPARPEQTAYVAPAVPTLGILEFPDPPECSASYSFTAEATHAMTDIIWVVDTSSSMDLERDTVRDNLNDFSQSISASGIDHRVILLADASEMTVPPPLGGSSNFLHVDQYINSNSALEDILNTYAQYASFLRADSVKHFVVVSDDESDLSASDFSAALGNLVSPGFGENWVFHSIVAYGIVPIIGCISFSGGGDAIGQQYLDLADWTAGVTAPICEPDWTPVFDALETAVETSADLPCEFELPELPEGATLDQTRTELSYHAGDGDSVTVPRVETCMGMGWGYDTAEAPSLIIACETVCDNLRADPEASLEIKTGCTITE